MFKDLVRFPFNGLRTAAYILTRALRPDLPRQARRMPRSTVLRLECLEARVVPAFTYTWLGTTGPQGMLASVASNWGTPNGDGTYTRSIVAPAAGDTLKYGTTSVIACTLDPQFESQSNGAVASININAGYTGTITLGESVLVTSTMTMSEPTAIVDAGSNTLSIGDVVYGAGPPQYAASFTWTSGTIRGGSSNGALVIGSGSSLSLPASTAILDGARAYNYGTAGFSNGSVFTLRNGATYVQSAGIFTVTGAGTVAGTAAETFSVASGATLNVNDTSTTLAFEIQAEFLLNGTLNLSQGVMQTHLTDISGTANQAAGTVLLLGAKEASGSYNAVTMRVNSAILGSGTTVFCSNATVYLSADTGNPTCTIGTTVNDYADYVSGGGTLIVTGTYNWYNSVWKDSGTIQVGTSTAAAALNVLNSTYNIKSMGRTLVNYGTVTWTANQNMQVGGTINNMSGALFDIQVAQEMLDALPTKGSFYNYTTGTLRKDTNTGQFNFNIQYYDRGGKIDNRAGFGFGYELKMDHGGIIANAAGATLLCDAGFEEDAGALVNQNGTMTVTSGAAVTGGTFNLAGTLGVDGGLVISGGAFNAMVGAINVTSGDMTVMGGDAEIDGSTINVSSGKVEVAATATLWSSTITASNGVLIDSDAVFSVLSLSSITGNVTDNGELGLKPLITEWSPPPGDGLLTVFGNFTQGSSGTLLFQLCTDNYTGYSNLSVYGSATISGNVTVDTLSFTVVATDQFNLIDATNPPSFAFNDSAVAVDPSAALATQWVSPTSPGGQYQFFLDASYIGGGAGGGGGSFG